MGRTYYYEQALPFVANPSSLVHSTGRQISWADIPDQYRRTAVLVKLDGAALADATSITVDALLGAIPSGTLLHFGESKEFARVTAAAAIGATTITVEALPSALEDNDEAYYGGNGAKVVPAGKIMAELSSGKLATRAERPGSETATCILESTAVEDDESDDLGHGCLVGGVIFSDMLPDAANAAFATMQTELNAAGVGHFVWEDYADDTA